MTSRCSLKGAGVGAAAGALALSGDAVGEGGEALCVARIEGVDTGDAPHEGEAKMAPIKAASIMRVTTYAQSSLETRNHLLLQYIQVS